MVVERVQLVILVRVVGAMTIKPTLGRRRDTAPRRPRSQPLHRASASPPALGRARSSRSARLVGFELDEERAAGDAVALGDVHLRSTVPSYGDASGVSIFIASSTRSGWRASTRSPGRDEDADHRARHRRRDAAARRRRRRGRAPARRRRAAARAAAAGRLSRHGAAPGAARAAARRRARAAGTRSGTRSSPRRRATTGCATSQRRNGRFVVTPSTSVSASASREPRRAPRRASAPCAISFAIIGS